MTIVYFVRHAEPNYENYDDRNRELTAKGLADRKIVTNYLADKGIEAVLSSPYKRAIDTVRDFRLFVKISGQISSTSCRMENV